MQLAPGVLASVSANPSCVKTVQYTSACQIGSGSATVLALPIPVTAYLVRPPTSSDLVGIDLRAGGGLSTIHAGAQLKQVSASQVATVLHFDLAGPASLASEMTLTVNGTLNGKPFTRMPTNCSPGHSVLTVVYAHKTETTTASPDFKPTGCANLPYHPKVSGTAKKDAQDIGASVTTTVTQGADEAASASTTLVLPVQTLPPNLASASLQNKNIPVGTATTYTPLLPTPLQGKVFFTGQLLTPTLTIKFPPPAVLTLVGTVDLGHNAVVFSGIPDVPVTKLAVTLFGGAHSMLEGICRHPTGPLGGSFTGQNGRSSSASTTITLTGCSTPVKSAPKLSQVRFAPSHFKAKSGTTLKFTLSEAASVTVTVTRKAHGHRAHHKCSLRAKRGAKCTVRIKRVLHLPGGRGANAFKLHLAKLPRGSYKATLRASAGGLRSSAVSARFTIR